MTGDNAARRAEDIGSQELSYAEVKAIASGNPAVLTLAEADAELQRLALLKKNHLDEQYVARRSVHDLPATIASLSDRLSKLTEDEATRTPTPVILSPLVAGRTHATTYPTFSAASWTLCRRRSVRRHASRSATTGGWVLASCSIRNSHPRSTSKVPPRDWRRYRVITTGHVPSSTPWNGWRTAMAPNATAFSETSESRNRNFATIRPDWASRSRTTPTWPN